MDAGYRVQEILFDQTTKDRGLYNIKFIENLSKRNDEDIYDFNGKNMDDFKSRVMDEKFID